MKNRLLEILGKEELDLILKNRRSSIDKDYLINSDRTPSVLKSLSYLYNHGRLGGSGYLSIIPIDHGIEHGLKKSFSINNEYYNPKRILDLAVEGGASAIVSTFSTLSLHSREYVSKIPLILKVTHNEKFSNKDESYQSFFSSADQAFEMGASGVAATLYIGQEDTKYQIESISQLFNRAHKLGLFTVLWVYLRGDVDLSDNDLRSQAIYIGANVGADIIKQKLDISDNIEQNISFMRDQVDHSCSLPLLTSGGDKRGDDFKDLARLSLINKALGGSGIIAGRKIFKRSFKEGVELLNFIQDIYLDDKI